MSTFAKAPADKSEANEHGKRERRVGSHRVVEVDAVAAEVHARVPAQAHGAAGPAPAAQEVPRAATGMVDLPGLGERAIFVELAEEGGAAGHERRQSAADPNRQLPRR